MDHQMSKQRTGWQPIAQYLAAHMHETVGDDRLDRALETMSGHLTRNPPHVAATFLPLRGAEGSVKAAAISPKGTVAVVLWRTVGKDEYDELCLVVWRDGDATRPKVIGTAKEIVDEDRVRVFFPEGSDEPAVCVRDKVHWGDWEEKLPWLGGAPDHACLTLWEADSRRFLSYIHEETAVLFPIHVSGQPAGGGTGALRGYTQWLGLVGGDVARIVREGREESLRWREVNVAAPLPGAKIVPESIGVSGGGIQFVAARGDARVALWTDGRERRDATVRGIPAYADGRVFAIRGTPEHDIRVEEFRQGVFVHVATAGRGMYVFHPELLLVGGRIVLTDANTAPAGAIHRHTLAVTEGASVSESLSSAGDLQIVRFHHGIGRRHKYLGSEETFRWQIPVEHPGSDWRREFPLYGTPFARLTAVEDAHGKAVMSWAFVDGTFHVLRYALPA